ncbi:glycosyltransferase [Jonesia quinghaiensis]|uniref:glycosyltransferase n=1 Tax=Jonesia quinghaiensis TaxID=262806 RepID=UPI001FDF8D89|nr:glycosyltransferase [Jonesia quinghaiensis]
MKLYTFWEGAAPSVYLKACVATWYSHFPELELTIIDHSNMGEWLEDLLPVSEVKKLSFAMQSDVVSAAVLSKVGGVFVDIDTIVTGERARSFMLPKDERLHCFGISPESGFHLALLSSSGPNQLARFWVDQIARRLSPLPGKYEWSHVGNAPLSDILKSMDTKDLIKVLDKNKYGVILETSLGVKAHPMELYRRIWFEETKYADLNYRNVAIADLMLLHNSWTPKWVKEITSIPVLLSKDNLFSSVICDSMDVSRFDMSSVPVKFRLDGDSHEF